MSIYSLKKCKEKDLPALIYFIKTYWKEDHVFVSSIELLKFQHYNPQKKEYNFILGYNTQTNEIDGVVGLIPVNQYDPDLTIYNETWGGIWKVRTDVKNNEIGILGLLLFEEFDKYNSCGGIGMSKIATKFYKLMKYETCTLNQYYILNYYIKDYKIAKIPSYNVKNFNITIESDYTIKKIENILEIPSNTLIGVYRPKKSLYYLHNRFQLHPFYNYEFWGVYDKNKDLKTILVTRTIQIYDSSIIRIVDVYGKLEGLGSLKSEFQKIMNTYSAEYIDIMNYGISSNVFAELGFEQLDVEGEIVIPNYFEPFIQKNITIHAGYKSSGNYVMFIGDSDQDRPNFIKK